MAGNSFPITNYPNGFSSVVTILGQPILSLQSNNAWWVDSVNGSNGNPGTFQRPFATLVRATAFMKAGDTIMVAAGHTETWSAVATMAMSKANVRVIGLGVGQSRPVFTLDTLAGTTVTVSAAGVTFVNCRFVAAFAGITSFFTTTTAKSFTLDTCDFAKTSTNYATYVVDTNTTDNAADGLTIVGCRWNDTSNSTLSFVKLDATTDSIVFNNNWVSLGLANDTAAGFTCATTKFLTNFLAVGNVIRRLNTSVTAGFFVSSDTTTHTGMLANNYAQTAVAGTPIWIVASSGMAFMENYMSGVADASGFILPARDS